MTGPYTEDEERRMDRAEDAYLRHRIGEAARVQPVEWQPWAMSSDEQRARASHGWAESHDEPLNDPEPAPDQDDDE